MSKIEEIFNNLIERYPVLESSKDDIYQAYRVLSKWEQTASGWKRWKRSRCGAYCWRAYEKLY